MLIIPLHQPLTLQRFPWVTAALILINVFVYFGLQSRDTSAFSEAAVEYERSGLVKDEYPLLLEHLRRWKQGAIADHLERVDDPELRAQAMTEILAYDSNFKAALSLRPPFPAGSENHESWRMRRAAFERKLELAFTPRHVLLFQEPSFARQFTAMFLHADAGHLIGNMLFLGLLGLMVECTLGAPLFLAVYLLGGIGGGLFSVVRHLSDYGSALGASGAIAALMGAMCVIWGMRKVRVFYWFFVVFDYVKIPALALLPFWLGWELFHMWSSPEAGIGFDAHAGGIMTGALLAFAIRKLGWERKLVLDEAIVIEEQSKLQAQARGALGRLDFAAAREATRQLVERSPSDRENWRLSQRAWRDRPNSPEFHEAARRLLFEPLTPRASIDEDIASYDEYAAAGVSHTQLTDADLARLAERWMQSGRLAPAAKLIERLLDSPEPAEPARRLALRLALAHYEARDSDAFQRIAGRLSTRCPLSDEAIKLQRLLATQA